MLRGSKISSKVSRTFLFRLNKISYVAQNIFFRGLNTEFWDTYLFLKKKENNAKQLFTKSKKTPHNGYHKGKTCLKTWFTKTEKMFLFLTLFKKLKNKKLLIQKKNENTKVRIIQ